MAKEAGRVVVEVLKAKLKEQAQRIEQLEREVEAMKQRQPPPPKNGRSGRLQEEENNDPGQPHPAFDDAAIQSTTDIMNVVAAAASRPLPIAVLLTRCAAATAIIFSTRTTEGLSRLRCVRLLRLWGGGSEIADVGATAAILVPCRSRSRSR